MATDPFAVAAAALFASPMACDAMFRPISGGEQQIRAIRGQPSDTAPFAGGFVSFDTNFVQFQRCEVPNPAAGDGFSFLARDEVGNRVETEPFILQGAPKLDVEGVTWSCPLEPA